MIKLTLFLILSFSSFYTYSTSFFESVIATLSPISKSSSEKRNLNSVLYGSLALYLGYWAYFNDIDPFSLYQKLSKRPQAAPAEPAKFNGKNLKKIAFTDLQHSEISPTFESFISKKINERIEAKSLSNLEEFKKKLGYILLTFDREEKEFDQTDFFILLGCESLAGMATGKNQILLPENTLRYLNGNQIHGLLKHEKGHLVHRHPEKRPYLNLGIPLITSSALLGISYGISAYLECRDNVFGRTAPLVNQFQEIVFKSGLTHFFAADYALRSINHQMEYSADDFAAKNSNSKSGLISYLAAVHKPQSRCYLNQIKSSYNNWAENAQHPNYRLRIKRLCTRSPNQHFDFKKRIEKLKIDLHCSKSIEKLSLDSCKKKSSESYLKSLSIS